MAVRVVRFYRKSSNILIEIVVRDSIFSFLRSFNRFSLARLVAFSTSLVTLRGGLDHPSSANGTGTVLPRKQSQQVHLGRCNHLDIGNLLSPWWRPGLHSLFPGPAAITGKGVLQVTCWKSLWVSVSLGVD